METNWRIKFKDIQNIISEFVFEDILNLFSIYSEFNHWINRPVPTVWSTKQQTTQWWHYDDTRTMMGQPVDCTVCTLLTPPSSPFNSFPVIRPTWHDNVTEQWHNNDTWRHWHAKWWDGVGWGHMMIHNAALLLLIDTSSTLLDVL